MAIFPLFFPPHGCLSIAGGRPDHPGQPRPVTAAQTNSGRVAGPNSDADRLGESAGPLSGRLSPPSDCPRPAGLAGGPRRRVHLES